MEELRLLREAVASMAGGAVPSAAATGVDSSAGAPPGHGGPKPPKKKGAPHMSMTLDRGLHGLHVRTMHLLTSAADEKHCLTSHSGLHGFPRVRSCSIARMNHQIIRALMKILLTACSAELGEAIRRPACLAAGRERAGGCHQQRCP